MKNNHSKQINIEASLAIKFNKSPLTASATGSFTLALGRLEINYFKFQI